MKNYDYNYNYTNNNGGGSPGPGPRSQGSPGPRPPRNNDPWDTLSWVIDVGLIFVCFPLGLFLTVANSMGMDIVGSVIKSIRGKSKSAGRSTGQNAYTMPGAGTAQAAAGEAKRKQTDAKPQQETERKSVGVRHADAGNKVKNVFGWILVGFGAVGALSAAAASGTIWSLLTYIATAIGGGALLVSALEGRRKEAKFRRCLTISGDKGIVDIAKLTKTLGIEEASADHLLGEMIDRGFYGEKAYIDHERGLLVIDPAEMRDVYRREDEAHAAKKAETVRAGQTVYEQCIEQIRQADIDIEDEVMSEKIRRMQAATAAIFKEVEEHPGKKPQIERFMNYYLPTTLKLLDSYARIEKQGVSGENMAKAKADIERIADTLVEGYEKQLDTLYRAEAIDIAGDVSVIENMMRRDGLTGQNDFGQTAGGH